jgi:purine-binding chemotaxis protein CheW
MTTSYLRFYLQEQAYAVPIKHVMEVVHLVAVTPVPDTPPEQLGVITLRNQVMPVIDLRRRLIGKSAKLTLSTPLIAMRSTSRSLAAVVDSVDDVIVLPDDFEPHPEAVVDKLARYNNEIVLVLNIDYLLAGIDY